MKVGVSGRRSRHLDEVALGLPQRVSALTRLFFAHSSAEVSRTEAGVLVALSERPHRITDLAAREAVTQPAVTQLVNRLQHRGWVTRETDPGDGRVVLARLTASGRDALERVRADYRALLHEEMVELDDQEVETLASAVAILDRLIARLGERAP